MNKDDDAPDIDFDDPVDDEDDPVDDDPDARRRPKRQLAKPHRVFHWPR